MLMPKAAMDENGLSSPRKNDVGRAGKITAVDSEPVTEAVR
jgi:hypothetical protein